MPYFTKKPVTIEARQYHGTESSAKDIIRWIGDWIIKGVAGEFYPCKYAIFEQTYEPTSDHLLETQND